jgi:peptidoglycan-N-acetylglucosamine deacetylase
MSVKKYFLHWLVFLIILSVTFQNTGPNNYFRNDLSQPVMSGAEESDLFIKIKEKAKTYNIKPIDARIDPIWHLIPGYNGLEVDVEASYEKMKKLKKFDEKKLVFKQVSPKVQLKDLGMSPIYKGNPEKPMVTFLINVAWGNEYLPKVLEVLKKNNVHTTFFLDGSWVKKYPDLAKMIYEEGHEIGNHAYSHPDLKKMTANRINEELSKTSDVIKAILGVTPKYFAPPSGSYRDEVVSIAANMNMYTILWSLDTVDWRNPNPNEMAQRIINKVHPGAMILMHPTNATANGLDMMIKGIKNKGYQIGTVSELLSEKRIIRNQEKKE